jgi:O-antigen/teichoic acid export membrane protein
VPGEGALSLDSIFKPALRLMAGRALAFGGTFLIPVVLARVFAPEDFGTYKQLLLIFTTLYAVVPLGMAESLYYFLPDDPKRAGAYVANAIAFLGAAGIAATALPLIAPANEATAGHLLALAAFAGLMLVSAPLEIVMISRKEYTTAARTYAVSDLARAALFTIPALITGRLEWLLGGAILFAAMRLILALGYLSAQLGPSLRPDFAALRTQLAYALPFGGAALLDVAQVTFHQYAVSYRYSAAAFALYSVGCLQIPLVEFLAGPAGNVMMVRMAELRDDRAAVRRLWHDMTRKLALVFVPLVVLVELLAGDLIVFLFTPLYAASVPIFRIWCLTTLLPVFQTDAVLRVHARTRFLLALNLLRLLAIAATIGPALQTFGLPGAALVTVATLAVTKGLALLHLRSLLGTGVAALAPWGALTRIVGTAMVASVPALIVSAGTTDATFLRIAVLSLVYATTYVALGLILLLTSVERRAIAAFFNRRMSWTAPDRATARS